MYRTVFPTIYKVVNYNRSFNVYNIIFVFRSYFGNCTFCVELAVKNLWRCSRFLRITGTLLQNCLLSSIFHTLGTASCARTLVRKCKDRKLCRGTEIDYFLLEVPIIIFTF